MAPPELLPDARASAYLLTPYVLLLGFILLQPVPSLAVGTVGGIGEWLADRGVPAVVADPANVEALLNAAMFAPAAFLAAMSWPRVHPGRWVVAGLLASLMVEALQWWVLPARSAELVDVLANTSGALMGVLVAVAVRHAREVRDQSFVSRHE